MKLMGYTGGTLNLTAGSNNTYPVVHTASSLALGESYSVDALDPWEGSGVTTGEDGQFLMLTGPSDSVSGSIAPPPSGFTRTPAVAARPLTQASPRVSRLAPSGASGRAPRNSSSTTARPEAARSSPPAP